MAKNIINTLPHEIINYWCTSSSSQTCTLWYNIWCAKPMLVKFYRYDKRIYMRANFHLTMLSKFRNLTALDLGSCENPGIESFTTLKSLDLDYNYDITDTILCQLTNICSLSIKGNNKITDVSVRYLPKITDLCINNNNQITNTMLETLTNLTKLDISRNNNITDSSLKCLQQLNHLTLKINKHISDESIMYLTNITYLSINRCSKVTDRSIINLVNLRSIYLYYVDTIGYRSLKKITNLTSINLWDCMITNNELGEIDNLCSLMITSRVTLDTSRSIKKLTRLEYLGIQYSGSIKNSDLWDLTNLKKLALGGCSRRRQRILKNFLPNTIILNTISND